MHTKPAAGDNEIIQIAKQAVSHCKKGTGAPKGAPRDVVAHASILQP